MKTYHWNEEKNDWLKRYRNISFEEIIFFLETGGLLDTYEHPNKEKYPKQSIFVVRTDRSVYIVPCIEEDEYYFLKTIIPNREAKKKYAERNNG